MSELPALVVRARDLAIGAHQRIDHRRKYSHQPYDVHLKAVYELVARVTDDAATLAAAWLHDIVEDTPVTLGDLRKALGEEVAALVGELTDVSRPSDGNRAARKALDREHLRLASPAAKTVKLADLIDNCRDISRHDPRFARVFLAEMADLLDVLGEGDTRLLEQARAAWAAGMAALRGGVERAVPLTEAESPFLLARSRGGARAVRLFSEAFRAEDIAEALPSFDAERPLARIGAAMRDQGLVVAGLRQGGRVRAYLLAEDLTGPAAEPQERPFRAGQILSGEAPLPDVIEVLTRQDYAFVEVLGEVAGVITRADIQKPIVRMWLFGVITLVEMAMVDRIRDRFPGSDWESTLPPNRLQKARELRAERRRMGQSCDLLDCLQLGDKGTILLHDPEWPAAFDFPSRSAAKQALRELQSLRNNLAHSQDIVSQDWTQIARLARQVASAAGLSPEWHRWPGAAGGGRGSGQPPA